MYGFINKKLIIFYNLSLLLLTTSCAPTPMDRVQAFHKAANSKDVEQLLSFYADDVRFELAGTPMVIEGKENLRKPIEEQFILNVNMVFTDIEINGNTATYKVKEQNDMLKAAGINAIYYEYDQITFEDGLIIEERAKPTKESMMIMGEFRKSFEKWASEKRAEEWAKLKTEGVTRENADKWLTLTRQWRKETGIEKY
jgi:ketosteroid isomerase-like protein